MKLSDYPAPPVACSGNSCIYFCAGERFNSLWNPLEDQNRDGGGESLPRRITFSGTNLLVDCNDILAVALVRKPFAWPLAMIAFLVLIASAYLTGQLGTLSWGAGLAIVAVALISARLLVASATYWVQVDYRDSTGALQRVYFRSDPLFWPGQHAASQLRNEMTMRVLGGSISQ